jgi:pimeloyl-ACP methyl ester carboxylesterase
VSRLSVNGISLGFDDAGPAGGPPLVLVHGHPFDRSMWAPQRDHFASAGYRVVVPDLRGYGESTVVPGITPLEAFARDIAALLDRLGVGRFVVGGLSMGGQIVMEIHRLFPERVRGLLLADTTAEAETPEGKRFRNSMADRLLREGLAPYAHEVLPKMIAPATIARRPDVAEHVLGMMLGTSPEGAAAALRGRAERPDYRATLAGATVPTLVVVGDGDEYTPLADARLIHDTVPGSTLAVVPDAAHMPNLEWPTAFNETFAAFLRTIPEEH